MSEPLKLDVEGVVREKTGGKAPRLLVWFLKKILHEDIFNKFFREHPDLKNFEFAREVTYGLLGATVSIEGTENIPKTSDPLFFVSNHPLGGLDGMIIALMLGEHRNYNVRVIVNEFLMAIKPLQGIFIPVHVGGKQSREQVEGLNKLYESNYDIMTFPSGKCSRRIDGKIQDPMWRKSFVQKAVEYKRDVVPIYFEGQNSKFFYNLAYWRTKLGIKQNIEMLFLADEMFKSYGKHFVVHVGKPIPYTTFDNSRTAPEWAEYVRKQIYQIKGTTEQ